MNDESVDKIRRRERHRVDWWMWSSVCLDMLLNYLCTTCGRLAGHMCGGVQCAGYSSYT